MAQLLSRVIEYIVNNPADKKVPAREFENVVKGFWSLISAIYASKWDLLPVENGKTFRALVGGNILNNYVKLSLVKLPEAPKLQNSMPLNDTNHKTPSPPPPSKKAGSNEKKALTSKLLKLIICLTLKMLFELRRRFPSCLPMKLGKC